MANDARFDIGNTGMYESNNNEPTEPEAGTPMVHQGRKCGKGQSRTLSGKMGLAGSEARKQGNGSRQDAQATDRECSRKRPGTTLIALRRVPTGMWAPVFLACDLSAQHRTRH